MKKIAGGLLVLLVVVLCCPEPVWAFFGNKKKSPPKPVAAPAVVEAPASIEATPESVEPEPMVEAEPEPVPPEAIPQEASVEPAPEPVAPPPPAAVDPAKDKVRKMRRKTQARLNNTQWDVDVLLMSGEGGRKPDVLVFEDNRFYSEKFVEQGFSPTNYTLTVRDDSSAMWETMQTAESGEVIFWRGELNDALTEMRGVLSSQNAAGESVDFSFISKSKTAVSGK